MSDARESAPLDGHLAARTLARRLDGELEGAEADRVAAHVAACDRCREALDEMAVLSRRFSAAVPLVDPAPPRIVRPPASRRAGRRVGPWIWRAAATIALLAGLGLAIAPVRAWVSERLGFGTGSPDASPSASTPARAPGPGRLRVAFVPRGETFVVRVSAAQVAGALRLSTTAGDTASAEILGGAESPATDLLVLPDGVAIRNAPGLATDVRVVVPRRVERVEVWIGDRIAWAGAPPSPAVGPIAVSLAPEADH